MDAIIDGLLGATYGLGIAAGAALAYHRAYSATVHWRRGLPPDVLLLPVVVLGLAYFDLRHEAAVSLAEWVELIIRYGVFFGVAMIVGYRAGLQHRRDGHDDALRSIRRWNADHGDTRTRP